MTWWLLAQDIAIQRDDLERWMRRVFAALACFDSVRVFVVLNGTLCVGTDCIP